MTEMITSINPANGLAVWTGPAATAAQCDDAVARANAALPAWSSRSIEERISVLQKFAEVASAKAEQVAQMISQETGKTLWESRGEAKLLPAKIDATLAAWGERCAGASFDLGAATAATRYAAHGVMVVLGPFNFPAHLPNGHVVAALLAGNTVVFKPSEKTPGTGEMFTALWHEAGLPADVMQCMQGGRATAEALIGHAEIHGVLFTGSYGAGRAINEALAGRPEVIVALEMGGNNPLVVHDIGTDEATIDAAAYTAVVSAFVTSGQRCTCARRIIVTDGPWAQPFVQRFLERTRAVRVGLAGEEPEAFYGPVVSAEQGRAVVQVQAELIARGCKALVELTEQRGNPALLSPGVLEAGEVALPDAECFGPLTTLHRVRDLEHAITEANATRFGLAAALLTQDDESWKVFRGRVRAGIVNRNGPTTGASGKLPFGGVDRSGNHRPAGSLSVDYCAIPVACLEHAGLALPKAVLPGL